MHHMGRLQNVTQTDYSLLVLKHRGYEDMNTQTL